MSHDPTLLNILARGLQAASEEMAANLIRSAFSSVVREARDCSTALLDTQGRVVAQAEMIPIQTAGLSASFAAAARQLDLSAIDPDHFVILNDPYSGGQHLNDIILFTPIFEGGEHLGWAGSTAHHLDIGGGASGVNTTATELIQEGLIIPPLLCRRGLDWNGGMIERLIFANIRTPVIGMGDLDAQFAANQTGVARMAEFARRYGAATVRAAMDAAMDYSERRMRAAIAEIPDGTWTGEALMDGDGLSPEQVPIRVFVTVTVTGDEAVIDFTGTDPQANSMINSPLASSFAGAVTALRSVLNDTQMPANDGCNRPLSIIIPEGTILNPRPGAAVRARTTSSCRALDAVHDALGKVIPDRVPGQGMNATTGLYLTWAPPGRAQVIQSDILGGGWGGARDYDGIHATDHILSSCLLTPTESLEQLNPHMRIEAFGLIQDSWGAGQFNGGMGIYRRYRILDDHVKLSLYSDRFCLPPLGREGASNGARAQLFVLRDGERIALTATSTFVTRKGDIVEMRLAGGGGWGPPEARSREAVARNLADDLISEHAARTLYAFDPETGA